MKLVKIWILLRRNMFLQSYIHILVNCSIKKKKGIDLSVQHFATLLLGSSQH